MMQLRMLGKWRGKWLIIGVLVYLIFLLITIPASVLIKQLAKHGIQVSSSSGSVWHGQVTDLRAGVLNLGNIDWQVRFMSLLTGKLAADVKLKQNTGFANGRVSIGLSGKLQLNQMSASLPLQSIVGSGGLPGGWTGTAQAKFDELILDNNWPVAARGTLDVIDLTGPASQPNNIGAYRLSFPANGSNATTVIGDLQDLDGASLSVAGQLKLTSDRNYLLETQVAARTNTPASIANGMQYLGAADAQGRRPFSLSGSF
ncbi:MAG: type II secretion system protein N [Steroidobacteraceae bacterium]